MWLPIDPAPPVTSIVMMCGAPRSSPQPIARMAGKPSRRWTCPSGPPVTSLNTVYMSRNTFEPRVRGRPGEMSDILFIKTSSLGDVIHHMPALAEARRQRPDACLSWLVEEAFAPLARLHPAVDAVIPVASRRWRRELHRLATWRELGQFVQALRAASYDEIIDAQGLARTAVMARLARGRRHGYDALSVREPIAAR